jgi:hypothetical protein
MKAILEFNLPEDNLEYLQTIKAPDMAGFLFELVYNTKKGLINRSGLNELDYEDGVLDVFAKINELLDEYNINIDELMN